jgi:hypothetical protein
VRPLLAVLLAAIPIPGLPGDAPGFVGKPATPRAIHAPPSPQHPFMAPNGSSNLHEDGWQTDASRRAGPLGRDVKVTSTLFARLCASVTFDQRGRIVSVCVGLDKVQMVVLDPHTLDTVMSMDLPSRPLTLNPFQSFGGGGYFYLDNQDRAVIPTGNRHLFIVKVGDKDLTLERDIDMTGTVPDGDSIVSVLPDWAGRLWFASREGRVGTIDRDSGAVHSIRIEPIGNSFAVSETGGVYIVSDAALYRFSAADDGMPVQAWRRVYRNAGDVKPGQTQAGSGTTPTLSARGLVAITDNADPVNVVVYTRSGRKVCEAPVFDKGASSTDQSLIGVGRSFIAENNYGYTGPAAVELGRSTTPGLQRIDVSKDLRSCRTRWRSDETAPSLVPKVSIPNGLVYTYTKQDGVQGDPWYLTALDFRTGRTVYKALAGYGLGFNNNYAPVTIGPDGTAYVGVLGGLIALSDAKPPAQPKGKPKPRLRLVKRCHRRAFLRGDTDWVTRWRVRRHGRRLTARIVLTDGRVVRRHARVPLCRG